MGVNVLYFQYSTPDTGSCCRFVQYVEWWFGSSVQTHRSLCYHHHRHHRRLQLPHQLHPAPPTPFAYWYHWRHAATSRDLSEASASRQSLWRRYLLKLWRHSGITVIIVLVCIVCNLTCVTSHLMYSLEASILYNLLFEMHFNISAEYFRKLCFKCSVYITWLLRYEVQNRHDMIYPV